jgi:type IV pilus assembly protein PilM
MRLLPPELSEKINASVQQLLGRKPKASFQPVIGLNIGRANMVASEVSAQKDGFVLVRCARTEIREGAPLTDQLKEFLEQNAFSAKRANVSLKGQGIVIRFLAFPKMSPADFASSIQFEAEKYLPFSLSEVVLDYHIISEGTRSKQGDTATMDVILVAARRTEVEKLASTVKAAGLELNAIDVDSFACTNAFERANPDMIQHTVGLIDLGALDTTLIIFDKGRLIFTRDIAFGGRDVTDSIRQKLNVSREEALQIQEASELKSPEHEAAVHEALERLFQELKLSLNYYYNQRQNPERIESLYISGGFSQLSILPGLLQNRVEVPVHSWDSTNQMALSDAVSQESVNLLKPYLPVSIGLAVRTK